MLRAAWFLLVVLAGSAYAAASNLTDLVTWDRFSLRINGTREFIQSGEFHYQRLPVPALWLDVFQKLKANGFNTVSIYFFWSYHSASPGVFDFTSPGKDVQRVFDAAKEAGLWVIARPGPYCNGETNAGGLPLWGSDGSLGRVRTSDETYRRAWEPWVAAIGNLIAKNQISNGGPVILVQIENELQETTHAAGNTLVVYMQQLEAAFRAAGVAVPFTSNEKGMRTQSWSSDYGNVGGAVDVYGLDSYPGGLSCTDRTAGFKAPRTYYQWFAKYAASQPVSLPEFEGGWFSGWGSRTFYDQCIAEHSPEFADVYYKNNIGQRTTLQNIYMAFGGTNWGHSAAPVVYTSYDYSALLRETRQQTTKLFQTKLVNLFATTSPDLLKTDMLGNGTGFRTSSRALFSWVLRNPDTGATFTVLQQASTPSTANVTASVTLDTSAGTVVVPDVALYGRQSKILVTDYALGGGGRGGGAGRSETAPRKVRRLLYCSADIATSASFGGLDVLVLYLQEGQTGAFAFRSGADDDDAEAGNATTFVAYGNSHITATTTTSMNRQAFTYVQGSGATAVRFSNNVLVYLLDQATAWRLWAPQDGGSNNSSSSWPSPTDGSNRLFVLGPYLVRSAATDWAHGVVRIQGDSDNATTLEAFVGVGVGGSGDNATTTSTTIHTIEWNGRAFPATRTPYGAYRTTIPGGRDLAQHVQLPSLANDSVVWYTANALPEADPAYDDSRWTVCNKTTTRSPVPPVTLPVLFSSDYGFYAGIKVYRGRFPATTSGMRQRRKRQRLRQRSPVAVNITASGGLGFGWTAWLNGQLLGGQPGAAGQATTSAVLRLPAAHLKNKGSDGDSDDDNNNNYSDNVLTVLVDYHGHDETSTRNGLGNPRGLLGAQLLYGDGEGDDGEGGDANGRRRPYDTHADAAAPPSGGFTSWRLAGNAGGPANIDPVRGPLNEGGLYGERLGWHLPGFAVDGDDAAFRQFGRSSSSSPFAGLTEAGVRMYVTTFSVAAAAGADGTYVDMPLGIELGAPAGTVARVQLWINGYQSGKFVPHLGPQTRFPVPPGILNVGTGTTSTGASAPTNTLVLSLWAMTAAGARLDRVALVGYDGGVAYETGFPFFGADGRMNSSSSSSSSSSIDALQPRWTDRREYA
ncbi:beta-galactosidase [Niveomyces insectorum RCEF 264]|uniref:beta-galactosidase n=1 Tax=Niveomyces insectorum RCEF 264 TaxID=1081102 RepID=A0A167MA13_9HYPO|nr:beta-galactosidase [Niveomyces insectorum RCEF 264]